MSKLSEIGNFILHYIIGKVLDLMWDKFDMNNLPRKIWKWLLTGVTKILNFLENNLFSIIIFGFLPSTILITLYPFYFGSSYFFSSSWLLISKFFLTGFIIWTFTTFAFFYLLRIVLDDLGSKGDCKDINKL